LGTSSSKILNVASRKENTNCSMSENKPGARKIKVDAAFKKLRPSASS
jgi:hypothetical protein